VRLTSIFCLMLVAWFSASAGDFPVPGPRVRWQADYCMYKVGSDDIVAVDPCMRRDGKRRYRNDCEAKKYYKRQICRMAREPEQSEEQCVADPSFMGPTVRNGGVGG